MTTDLWGWWVIALCVAGIVCGLFMLRDSIRTRRVKGRAKSKWWMDQ